MERKSATKPSYLVEANPKDYNKKMLKWEFENEKQLNDFIKLYDKWAYPDKTIKKIKKGNIWVAQEVPKK